MNTLERRILTTAASQFGAFAAAQFPELESHVVDTRVRQGRWCRHGSGVFSVSGSSDIWQRQLWIALLKAGDGAVVGRRSAARLHGLTFKFGDVIDIVQPETTTPRSKPHTSRRTSRLPAAQVVVRDGFPVTTLERTLFDLAGLTSQQRRRRGWIYLPPARVERLVDDALVRKLTTIAKLTQTFVALAGRGRPGTALLRELLEARSDDFIPTESNLEDLFLAFVVRFDLPTPQRQVALGSGEEFIGRVDFLFEAAKLVVEVDGRTFHAQRGVQRNDRRRDLQLLRAGWRVLRLSWRDLTEDAEELAELLRGVLSASAA